MTETYTAATQPSHPLLFTQETKHVFHTKVWTRSFLWNHWSHEQTTCLSSGDMSASRSTGLLRIKKGRNTCKDRRVSKSQSRVKEARPKKAHLCGSDHTKFVATGRQLASGTSWRVCDGHSEVSGFKRTPKPNYTLQVHSVYCSLIQ